eukprot:scaffold7785_cov248-Pinguiococcus_pyrenoidosus.AAC.2
MRRVRSCSCISGLELDPSHLGQANRAAPSSRRDLYVLLQGGCIRQGNANEAKIPRDQGVS